MAHAQKTRVSRRSHCWLSARVGQVAARLSSSCCSPKRPRLRRLFTMQHGTASLATTTQSLASIRMPTVVFPSPGSGFYCDPVTGCFVPVQTPPNNGVSNNIHGTIATDSSLPKDPRLWSREDVACWLRHVSANHGLPAIPLDRFLMNGKALCLMTMDMFVQRVPLGGKLLYKDFQLRLCAAMYAR